METSEKLYINMLGNCSLSFGTCTISDEMIRSRKFWITLEYLLLNREKNVSQSELISILYPGGESENPGNALKTLIHRIRCALDTLGFMDSRNIIVNMRGAYTWNNSMNFEVDTDRFNALYQKSEQDDISEDERLSCCLEALGLYKGGFLAKLALEHWVAPLNTHYKSLYITLLHNTVALLEKRGDYRQIISICRQASEIDPYDEFPYISIILSLVGLGENKQALNEYNKMSRFFYRQLGTSPSLEIRKVYREIIKTTRLVETDIAVIQDDLKERSFPNGAFFCEYEMFKDLYRIKVRAASRSGEPVYICLLSFEPKPDASPSLKTLNHFMDKLQNCISLSLRRCDVYSKYSISQYIVLLPSNTYESGILVMDRIVKRFKRENPRAPFSIEFTLRAMDVLF